MTDIDMEYTADERSPGQRMCDQMELQELHIVPGSVDMRLKSREFVNNLGKHLVYYLLDAGKGELPRNFCGATIDVACPLYPGLDGERFSLIVQRIGKGKVSPAEKLGLVEAAVRDLTSYGTIDTMLKVHEATKGGAK